MVIKIREKIVRKYGLKYGEKIYRKTLQEISNKEFINLSDLIFILGCHYNILYKREYNLSRINLLKEYSSREKIKLLKMDLKYLEHFGCRMYSINEIIEICTIYKVSLDDFLTYLRRKKYLITIILRFCPKINKVYG